MLFRRGAGLLERARNCQKKTPPAIPFYKLLQAGQCHSTYYCDGKAFLNVCANARSAIQLRGRTSVLTSVPGNTKHDTGNFYREKFGVAGLTGAKSVKKLKKGLQAPQPGGDPPRGLDAGGDPMKNSAVNRLIYYKENGDHRRDLARLYKQAGINAGGTGSKWATGFTYCMEFPGAGVDYPTGQGDDAYLLESSSHNRCAQPYGVEFTLVTRAFSSFNQHAGIGRWDPWFDRVDGRKPAKTFYKKAGDKKYRWAKTPPVYCEEPSPGRKIFDEASQSWKLVTGKYSWGVSKPRNDPGVDGFNLACQNPPGSSGSGGSSGTSASTLDEELLENRLSALNITEPQTEPEAETAIDTVTARSRNVSVNKAKRADTGSYVDSKVYTYLGCANDEYDPCVDGVWTFEPRTFGPDNGEPGEETGGGGNAPDPAKPGGYFLITWADYKLDSGARSSRWMVYAIPWDTNFGPCDITADIEAPLGISPLNIPYPKATILYAKPVFGVPGVVYTSDGTGPGYTIYPNAPPPPNGQVPSPMFCNDDEKKGQKLGTCFQESAQFTTYFMASCGF
ncbi:hypothetical protein B0J14DRAFT_669953 [Halenospora varia]|nr:hypothetical protein B0J14DRAFT_669953 [Halenospora varia]